MTSATTRTFLQLRYAVLPAPAELAEWLGGLSRIENLANEPHHFTVLPDGYVKLISIRAPGLSPQLLLSGLWTRAHAVTVPAHATLTGVQFKLLAAEHLFPTPAPLNAACLLPEDSWLSNVLPDQDLSALAQHVATRLAAHLALVRPDPRKRALFAALHRTSGLLPVAQVASETGWSLRQLHRYFQARFGLSVKAYGSVLRSYAAAQQLRPANLFASGNYCDQSHGIRELKKYTGATPRQLDQHRHDRFIQLCPVLVPDLCAVEPFLSLP